jgi:hypothetical protein
MTTTRRQLLLSTGALAGASMLPVRGAPLASNLQSSQQVSEDVANALNVWDFRV